jgi:AAA domain
MMSQNPFIVGRPVPPDRFIGRTTEIETAFDQILGPGNLAIWGGPGMGKSSFLELLASPQAWQLRGYDPSQAVIVLLSCRTIRPFSPMGFWQEVLNLLKDELDVEPELQTQVYTILEQGEANKEGLRQILRQLGEKDKFLLLLVDDYDVALHPCPNYTEADIEAFLSDCRNLASYAKGKQHLSMVVTSLRRLNELGPKLKTDGSPWYNHHLFQPVKPFTDNEVATLLGSMPMTAALREGIREMCDGHPALLQQAGHLLYRELRAGHVPDPAVFARDFWSSTEHFFEDIWTMASETEQVLMILIALSNLGGCWQKNRYVFDDVEIIFSQKERELNDLGERGVIVRKHQDGKTIYTFASSMMEWWVVKEIENSDEAWLQQRQRIFLNLMSRKRAENLTKAIYWLWQHREEIPSILEWLGKVSAAFPKGLIQS